MNRRQVVGALGGGGWQPHLTPEKKHVSKEKKDQVLSEMFEMFLDVLQPDIIESVVHSCNYNSLKAMEALISISSQGAATDKHTHSGFPGNSHNKVPAANGSISGLDAISVAYSDDDVIVEHELEGEIPGNVTPLSNCVTRNPISNHSFNHKSVNLKGNGRAPLSFADLKGKAHAVSSMVQGQLSLKSKSFGGEHDRSYQYIQSIENIQWHVENGMKILIFMRGCPGSGKSFLAKQIIEVIGGDLHQHVFSSDNYFIRRGKYIFQSAKLPDAHAWNQKNTLEALESGISPVIIDNTHTQTWEMDVYVKQAVNYGYNLEVLEPQTAWFFKERELFLRNTHGIPFEKIQLMLNRYEHNVTLQVLMRRAESMGLKYKNYPPQRAPRPVGIIEKSNRNVGKFDIFCTELLKKQTTGDPMNEQTSHVSPQKLKSAISPISSPLVADNMPFDTHSLLETNEKISSRSDDSPHMNNLNKNLRKLEFLALNEGVEKMETSPSETTFSNATVAPSVAISEQVISNAVVLSSSDLLTHSKSDKENEVETNVCEEDKAPVPQNSDIYISSEDEEISDCESLSLCLDASQIYNQCHDVQPDVEECASSTSSIPILDNSAAFVASVELSIGHSDSDKPSSCEENVLTCEFEGKDETNLQEEEICPSLNMKLPTNPTEELSVLVSNERKNKIGENCDKLMTTLQSTESELVNFPPPASINPISFSYEVEKNECSLHSLEANQSGLEIKLNSDNISVTPASTTLGNLDDLNNCCMTNVQLPENPDSFIAHEPWHDSDLSSGVPKNTKEGKSDESHIVPVRPENSEPNNEISWTFCENGAASWQTIDKMHEEFYRKAEPKDVPHNQRAKFISLAERFDVSDKETMTLHSDFRLLCNANTSTVLFSDNGVKVLSARNRDINLGRNNFERKVHSKLMFDKGTSIESDISLSDEQENHEKLAELCRLFPKVPEAGLTELLEKCLGDVNWVSNLLLDTDNDVFSSTFFQESNDAPQRDTGTSVCSSAEDPLCQTEELKHTASKPSHTQSEEFIEEAKEIKRHLEKSFVINSERYSPHLLTIRNFRKASREGAVYKNDRSSPSASSELHPTREEPFILSSSIPMQEDVRHNVLPDETKVESEEGSDEDEDDGDYLELIFGQDFVQQLLDKFGSGDAWSKKKSSPVVKIPVSLARHIHYYLITSQANLEDEEEAAMRMQCEEDERIAWQLLEDMRRTEQRSESSPTQLQEIMDMQLAEAIYQADLNALQKNSSEETMATVLAKRLLQDNFPKIDSKVLNEMLRAHNNSFEETFKVLRQSITTDSALFSDSGRELREKERLDQAKRASLSETSQGAECVHVLSNGDVGNLDPGDAISDASEFRKTAAMLEEQRKECYMKARDAYQRKERSVAAYYAQLANCHKKNIEQAHARAATSLVAASVMSRSRDTIDLHYLRVAEALQVFDLFLDHHITRFEDMPGKVSLYVITGRGANSIDGKSRIKPAVIRRIKERKLEYKEENPGLLKVFITRHSVLSSHK